MDGVLGEGGLQPQDAGYLGINEQIILKAIANIP
jgi:hypothetical protein